MQWKTLNAEITKGNAVRHTENVAVGSNTLPVYVQANGSVATITSYSGNAGSATKLQNARNITITDGIHAGAASSFNGTANISVNLPTDIKFTNLTATTITGTVSGTASAAEKLTTANAGSATQPVYFSGGKPTACNNDFYKSILRKWE